MQNIYMYVKITTVFYFQILCFNFISKNRMSISKHIFILKNCLFSLSWRISRQLNISLIINVINLNLTVSIFCWKSSYFRKLISYLIKVHATLKKNEFPFYQTQSGEGNHFFPYQTFAFIAPSNKILSAFRSRWRIVGLWEWRKSMADETCIKNLTKRGNRGVNCLRKSMRLPRGMYSKMRE